MSRNKLLTREKRKSPLAVLQNKERIRTKSRRVTPAMKPFEDHPFYKNVMKYAVVPLWKENQKAKQAGKEIENLEGSLMYHFRVFEYAGSLYEGLKRLHDIPLFMQRGFSLSWMDKMNLAPQEWFVYNYSNYRVVATGIFDTALLVANDVLDIKIEPRNINRKFLNRPEIKENGLFASLEKIDQTVEQFRKERNKYVHRSTRPEIDFVDNLYAYHLLREAKEKGFYKGDLPTPKKANAYYNEERDKKTSEIRAETKKIFSAVIEFLDALSPVYLRKIKELS
ncbi:MAG: hypothetical protein J0M11_09940 [Anaerolineae bacterium]|nr:hypothetical protein [Anaerolineae bacterium]